MNTKSIAGNVVVAIVNGQEFINYTYCPDTGIKHFFSMYPLVAKADFELWERIWRSGDVSYSRKPLGEFTRKQIEEAGENPVAETFDMFAQCAINQAVKQAKQSGASPYSRCRELATTGIAKAETLAILVVEFPGKLEKKLKGMIHSVYAQLPKAAK